MSRPQEPHRPFFPFGNPFRMITPKGSQMSPRLRSLLTTFEETLAERLRKLNTKNQEDVLSLTWLKLAMESLCQTHRDIKTLITDLEFPITDWDEKWIDVYLDISVKLLDICIAFSSELTKLSQGHLLLQCVLHKLASNTSNEFLQVRSSLDSWRQRISSKNPRLGNCSSILNGLVESLDLPKVKNSAKGKVLMNALYGVKVETMFICSVFTAACSGSSKNLLNLTVPNTFLWAQAFSDLQANVNGEIRKKYSCQKFTIMNELDAVDSTVKKLYPMIQDGFGPIEVEAFQNSIADLRREAEKLSQGLDLLAKEVDGFFKIVLTGRDALLCNLRPSGTLTNPMQGSSTQGQVVR